MSLVPHTEPFVSPALRHDNGVYHYLPLSPEIADSYLSNGVKRVIATLNGVPFRRAILGNADGERFLVVGLTILREIRAVPGDLVIVQLAPDPEPDRIDLGDEFTEVLEMDEEASARFFGMTPGKQRGLCYYVNSAKREETRIKRALEIAHKLKTYTLYGDLRHDA